jgi:DNA-binding beta-propeller fold protein YncE
VWIGGSGGTDTHILKFGRDGRFIRRFGEMDSAAVAAAVAAAAARAAAAAAETTYRGMSAADRAAANAARAGGGAGGGRTGGRAAGAAGGGRAGARGAGGGARGGGGLPADSRSTSRFGGVAQISFDPQAREAYVADGYRNRRVAVLDIETGAVKRFWGAYGRPPMDTAVPPYDPAAPAARHFRNPVHCAEPTNDGFVYVCDRASNRIQVFQKNGTFVREKIIMPNTRAEGAVWDIAFSRDPQQRYMYVADGRNMKVHILDRQTLEVLTSFGDGGRIPGAFLAIHSIAVDSRGNIYTGETDQGKRVQKFVFKGIGSVPRNQGILWPRR